MKLFVNSCAPGGSESRVDQGEAQDNRKKQITRNLDTGGFFQRCLTCSQRSPLFLSVNHFRLACYTFYTRRKRSH